MFVRLPDRVARIAVSVDRRSLPVAVDVAAFAGTATPSADGETVRLASPAAVEIFDADDAPLAFSSGDVGAVVAVMAPESDSGPIIAAANLDADARVDLLGREDAVLAAIDVAPRRGPSRRAADMLGAVVLLAMIGAAAYAAAALAIALAAAGAFTLATAPDFSVFRDALLASAAVAQPVPTAVATIAVAVGLALEIIRVAAVRRAERARRRRAMEQIWAGAAEALRFVQENVETFRSRPSAAAKRSRGGTSRAARQATSFEAARAAIAARMDRVDGAAPRSRPSADHPPVDPRDVPSRTGQVRLPGYLS